MKWKYSFGLLPVILGGTFTAIQWAAPPDLAKQGRDIFDKKCSGCHALDRMKGGPALRGVLGRQAGSDPQFPSSEALKKSQFIWDASRLDKWLTDPESLVPDNEMPFRLQNSAERAAVIEYLKQNPSKRTER